MLGVKAMHQNSFSSVRTHFSVCTNKSVGTVQVLCTAVLSMDRISAASWSRDGGISNVVAWEQGRRDSPKLQTCPPN